MAFHGDDLGFQGNLYVRHLAFDVVGDTMDGHAHHFNHVTLLTRGIVDVRWRDADRVWQSRRYSAPAFIHVPAHIEHLFTAVEADTEAWCVFAVRDLTGQPLDHAHVEGETVIGF
jgi:quercetin dioxygenase-like cupin family protein